MKNKVIRSFVVSTLILIIIVSLIHMFFIPNEVQGLSSTYTQNVKSGISAFPESYQIQLAYLKYLHPNWEFKAYNTGIDWSEVTSSAAENKCLANTIYKNYTLDPSVLCVCGQSGDVGYYCASAKTVNYYLDPRNFLGEAMVFQFLDLSNGSGVSRQVVESAVSGTYLSSYVDTIMTASEQSGVSPLQIVATIFQELGKTGVPNAISGKVTGYNGLYNFYNYGATDGGDTLSKALETARSMGWTTPQFALIDGAKRVLANGYISAGQTTKYFYKFDVVGNKIVTESSGNVSFSSGYFYNHQYMTNLRDPSSQAGSLYDIYAENGILNSKLTFTIPVYNNMPSSAITAPTSLSGDLYYINSLKKYGVQFRQTAGGTSLGNIYKDTRVQLLSNEGSWSRVKIIRATGYDSASKRWNSTEQIGYVSTEYLTKVGTAVPDYRSKVNMGAASSSTTTPTTPAVTQTSEFKIDGTYIKTTPTVKVSDIKSKNPNAVIKNASGTDISTTTNPIGTGYTVTIDGKTYTAVKYGDVNGDGNVKATDYVLIKNYIMNGSALGDIYKLAADTNKDGNVKATDYVQIKNYIMGTSIISL